MPTANPSSDGSPPLAGLTVLDFSRVIAGPFLTQMLADFGADVIKVEAPGLGDDFRHFRPIGWTKDAPGFVGLTRNKRSIEIDIASAAGQDLCRRLASGNVRDRRHFCTYRRSKHRRPARRPAQGS